MPPRPFRLFALLTLTALAGCGGPATLSQRFVGEWTGRAESSAERVQREWPGGRTDGAGAETPDTEPTDLEKYDQLRVELQLKRLGGSRLSINGERALEGRWSLAPGEGRRATLEITIESDSVEERRRFQVELLPDYDHFVLQEEGADPRFGRMLFTRAGAEAPGGALASAPK